MVSDPVQPGWLNLTAATEFVAAAQDLRVFKPSIRVCGMSACEPILGLRVGRGHDAGVVDQRIDAVDPVGKFTSEDRPRRSNLRTSTWPVSKPVMRTARITFAPTRARSLAVKSPSPLLAPVTISGAPGCQACFSLGGNAERADHADAGIPPGFSAPENWPAVFRCIRAHTDVSRVMVVTYCAATCFDTHEQQWRSVVRQWTGLTS